MFKLFSTIILCFTLSYSFAQNADQYLDMANKAYDAHKTDEAKALYEKAALRNSAEAHYQLAYKFILSDGDRLYHLLEATKGGHEQGTFELFQEVFRHNLNIDSVSSLALSAYDIGRARNPKLNFYFMDDDLATMRHCVEAGPLNMDLFLKKHGLTLDSIGEAYGIWRLAEGVSRGRFGTADPRLILQLACRDGFASMEKVGAVQAAYASYKEGRVMEFKACDYVTSGYGQGFCAQWQAQEADKAYKKRIQELKKHLNSNAVLLLQPAYDNAVAFIEAKADREEGSGGSGRAAWVIGSVMEQKSAWLDLIQHIDSGLLPQTWTIDTAADKKLNATYRQVLRQLKKQPLVEMNAPSVTDTDIVSVQRLWIPYRDASARLYAAIMPNINEAQWKNWLTTERTLQLKNLIEMSESLNQPGK